MEFKGQRLFIAPYTPKTTMFLHELQEINEFVFLGFLDNFQEGKNISKHSEIKESFDYVLILSENHGNAIFKDFSKKIPQTKLLKVVMKNNVYEYLKADEVQKLLKTESSKKHKQQFLYLFTRLLDFVSFKRDKIIFISKGSITSNNKALFTHCHREKLDTVILTDNKKELQDLKKLDMQGVDLESYEAYLLMAKAKVTIQDQANITEEINLLSPKQKTVQMWHGIPLKRLNKLTTVSYDYLISTSDFINTTSLSNVINAREYKDFGYPRNDLLLKEEHDDYDLLFCDKNIYNFAKENYESENKILLYMPTHRESSKAAKIPLDFELLNKELQKINATLIVKLHHFVQTQYENKNYSNILFHATHGDVYPLLKYTDILITDYSSVYFDFLLLDRPIIFFDYDRDEYEANMQGFLYDYEEFTPGIHVKNQDELCNAILQSKYYNYSALKSLLYTHKNAQASLKIIKHLQEIS